MSSILALFDAIWELLTGMATELWASPIGRAAILVLGGLVALSLVARIGLRLLSRLAGRARSSHRFANFYLPAKARYPGIFRGLKSTVDFVVGLRQYSPRRYVRVALTGILLRLSASQTAPMRWLLRLVLVSLLLVRLLISLPGRLVNALGWIARTGLRHAFRALEYAVAPFWALAIYVAAKNARGLRSLEPARKPRLVSGPYPNTVWLDISKALATRGYTVDTYVYYNFPRIWNDGIFTWCKTEQYKHWSFVRLAAYSKLFLHYKVFIDLIRRYDVFHGTFYAGFLRETPLERWELYFLHLAGCKQISISIGGDVAHLTDIDSHLIRHGFQAMYSTIAKPSEQRRIKSWIDHYCEHSDFIFAQSSYMIDALPRWDLLTNSYWPLDTKLWKSDYYSNSDGRNAAVVIGHSPNHRPLKGTNFLIKAVNELRREGLKIELRLIEGKRNDVVRDILAKCDIVVADLVLQGYSVMAIEGLALGRPVLQDISDPHYNRVYKLYSGLDQAPFVSVPLEEMKDKLRELVVDPAVRKRIGLEGRAYAEKFHSYEAVGRFWEWVYEYVWFNRRERITHYHPDWPVSTISAGHESSIASEEVKIGERARQNLAFQLVHRADVPIGVYPYCHRTQRTVDALIRTRVLKSTDFLVVADDQDLPSNADNWPQAKIRLNELKQYGVSFIYQLETTADVERELLGNGLNNYVYSVNDLEGCVYPQAGQLFERRYRKVALKYASTVVPPLHFSNFAYIQYLGCIPLTKLT